MNQYEVKRKQESELQARRAQKLVKETVKENIDYYHSIFSKYLGQEEASKLLIGFTEEGEAA